MPATSSTTDRSSARRSKTRTGCTSCKKRRIKCGEETPACLHCVRVGLECPGYARPLVLKWRLDGLTTKLGDAQQTQARPERHLRQLNNHPPPLKGLVDCSSAPTPHRAPEPVSGVTSPPEPTFRKRSEDAANLRRSTVLSPGQQATFDGSTSKEGLEAEGKISVACVLHPVLQHQPTQLITYYICYISRACSIFHSDLNPFKTTVLQMIYESEALYLLVQATSAAHMTWTNRGLKMVALALQNDGIRSVQKSMGDTAEVSDGLILSVFYLGMTASWFKINDTGSIHVQGGRVLLKKWLARSPSHGNCQRSAFILSSIIYWQTMFSFVGHDPLEDFLHHTSLDNSIADHDAASQPQRFEEVDKKQLMPLTGISMTLFNTLGKVAAICQSRQLGISMPDVDARAEWTETVLLQWQAPDPADLADMEDAMTSPRHIVQLTEAIRLAGLLQLYSRNGSLLGKHVSEDRHFELLSVVSAMPPSDLRFAALYPAGSSCTTEGLDWRGGDDTRVSRRHLELLRGLAVRILETLQRIPSTSGTSTLQPLLLAIAAAWIARLGNPQLSSRPSYPAASSYTAISTTSLTLTGRAEEDMIRCWRDFIRARFQSCNNYMGGLLPTKRVQTLIEEVWRRNGPVGVRCDWITLISHDDFRTLFA